MFQKSVVSLLAVLLSPSASASVMTYGFYSHDTATDIVVGDGLEWLQWDRTLGWSVTYAKTQLSTIHGGGWQIASNEQMASLFVNFFPATSWDADENTTQGHNTGLQLGVEAGPAWSFVQMFGDTYDAAGFSYEYGEGGFELSRAVFGNDPDSDNLYNSASVSDDYLLAGGVQRSGFVSLSSDTWPAVDGGIDAGVVLVRSPTSGRVPEPSVIALLGLGLVGLGVRRRNARRM